MFSHIAHFAFCEYLERVDEFKAPTRPPLTIRELERRYLEAVRSANLDLSIPRLARAVGLHHATLYRLLKRWRKP